MQRSCSTVQGLKVQSQIRCACSSRSTARLSSKSCAEKQSVEVCLDRIREPSHCFGSGRPTSSTTTRRVPTSEAHVRRGHQKVIGVSPTGRLERLKRLEEASVLERLKRLEQAPLVEQYLASD